MENTINMGWFGGSIIFGLTPIYFINFQMSFAKTAEMLCQSYFQKREFQTVFLRKSCHFKAEPMIPWVKNHKKPSPPISKLPGSSYPARHRRCWPTNSRGEKWYTTHSYIPPVHLWSCERWCSNKTCWQCSPTGYRTQKGFPIIKGIWPNGIIFHQPGFSWNSRGFPLLFTTIWRKPGRVRSRPNLTRWIEFFEPTGEGVKWQLGEDVSYKSEKAHVSNRNTPTKINECPLKRDYFSGECIFQPLIFRGHVSFQGSSTLKYCQMTCKHPDQQVIAYRIPWLVGTETQFVSSIPFSW